MGGVGRKRGRTAYSLLPLEAGDGEGGVGRDETGGSATTGCFWSVVIWLGNRKKCKRSSSAATGWNKRPVRRGAMKGMYADLGATLMQPMGKNCRRQGGRTGTAAGRASRQLAGLAAGADRALRRGCLPLQAAKACGLPRHGAIVSLAAHRQGQAAGLERHAGGGGHEAGLQAGQRASTQAQVVGSLEHAGRQLGPRSLQALHTRQLRHAHGRRADGSRGLVAPRPARWVLHHHVQQAVAHAHSVHGLLRSARRLCAGVVDKADACFVGGEEEGDGYEVVVRRLMSGRTAALGCWQEGNAADLATAQTSADSWRGQASQQSTASSNGWRLQPQEGVGGQQSPAL